MSDDFKRQRFGKYLLLDHLVDGGMAQICLARFLGEQADKLVAIKMVQPQFSNDKNFVQMFEDELKITFGLIHPNIVQIYDYGIVDKRLYQAMEFVDGKNLKEYLDRLKKLKFVFPVEISVHIISQVCQALNYAHNFADKMSGKRLNIIHRDISPHNIMLTFDGSVKVIDFGIAKADSNSEKTQVGTIKGKLSYLAPEYIEGMELDHRYDQFAVGLTLWELLCSRKLFTGKNDIQILKLVQNCEVPAPSSINPNVPKELDEIIMKALSKDRTNRFEDMDKFNRALVKFLYSNYPEFNATDLGYFAKQLFKDEIKNNQKKYFEYGSMDMSKYFAEVANEQAGTPQKSKPAASGIQLDFGKAASTNKTATIKRPTTPRTTTSSVRVNKTRSRQVQVKQAKTDDRSRSLVFKVITAASVAVAAYVGLDYLPSDKKAELERSVAQVPTQPVESSTVNLETKDGENIETIQETGSLLFMNFDPDMKVWVNGKKVAMDGLEAEVPLNTDLRIEVRKEGFNSFKTQASLSENKKFTKIMVPELSRAREGIVSSGKNYANGSKLRVNINGEWIVKELPFSNERFPAGSYEAYIKNPQLGTEKKVRLEVEANKRVLLE